MESRQHALETAHALKEIGERLNVGIIYKTSFDKANRTSASAARGIGLKDASGRWSGNIWAKNLFDQEYAAAFGAASANTPYIAILGEPRTFGLTVTGRY